MRIPASLRRIVLADIALLILVIAGVEAVLYATKWGIGLSPDSASYIAGAIGIAEGKGYGYPIGGGVWVPTTSWPPLYPALMAVPIALGLEPLVAARWLNAVLMGLNILVVGLLLRRICGIRSVIPILGATLFLLNRDTVLTLGWAWSEGLFVFLGFLGLLWLDRYLDSGRVRSLVLFGVFTGLAMLTRYSGVAFVLVGILAVLVFPGERGRRSARVRDAVIFLGISGIPLAFWSARNMLVSGVIAGAGPGPSAIGPDEWQGVYRIVYLWFMPGRVGEPVRSYGMILAGLILAGIALYLVRMTFTKGSPVPEAARGGLVGILFVLGYLGILLFSRLFVRFFPLDDPRQFVPLIPALLMALSGAWVILLRKRGRTPAACGPRLAVARLIPLLVLASLGYSVIMLGSHASHTANWLLKSHSAGMGYSNESWRRSTLIETVRLLPLDTPLFSNAYDALFLLTDREVYPIPRADRKAGKPQNRGLATDWRQMVDLMRDQGGFIVYFFNPTRGGMVDEGSLTEAVQLCSVLNAAEGRIYQLCEEPQSHPN